MNNLQPDTTLMRLRAICLTEALDRHDDDDRAMALAVRLQHFMLTGEDPVDRSADISEPVAPEPAQPQRQKRGLRVNRRFTESPPLDPENVNGLAADHPAIVEGRTLFPSTVADPLVVDRVLVSGRNNRKLGEKIVKGPWAGMPLYQLTLEERATCPASCSNWRTCYGNGMQMARRHAHGPALEAQLDCELAALAEAHPSGFAVRLHTLGDFYSVDYVARWADWLAQHRALHVFGYTAWPADSDIGETVDNLNLAFGSQAKIRRSSTEPGPGRAVTIYRMPEGPVVDEGIVCPAETGKTECCGTCGLCWNPAAWDKSIAFIAHGRVGKRSEATPKGLHKADPAKLSEQQERAWQVIAESVSETGLSPIFGQIAIRAKVSLANVQTLVQRLEEKGYIRREGNRRSLVLHVLKWPEGVTPRETVGRSDQKTQQRSPRPAPAAPVEVLSDRERAQRVIEDRRRESDEQVPAPAPTVSPTQAAPVRKPSGRPAPPSSADIEAFIKKNGVRRFEPGTTNELAVQILEKNGHEVRASYHERVKWTLDGRKMERSEVLAKANEYRIAVGLEPFSLLAEREQA